MNRCVLLRPASAILLDANVLHSGVEDSIGPLTRSNSSHLSDTEATELPNDECNFCCLVAATFDLIMW